MNPLTLRGWTAVGALAVAVVVVCGAYGWHVAHRDNAFIRELTKDMP